MTRAGPAITTTAIIAAAIAAAVAVTIGLLTATVGNIGVIRLNSVRTITVIMVGSAVAIWSAIVSIATARTVCVLRALWPGAGFFDLGAVGPARLWRVDPNRRLRRNGIAPPALNVLRLRPCIDGQNRKQTGGGPQQA
jgi:hypothetical protein